MVERPGLCVLAGAGAVNNWITKILSGEKIYNNDLI